jgi:hypothetical protein
MCGSVEGLLHGAIMGLGWQSEGGRVTSSSWQLRFQMAARVLTATVCPLSLLLDCSIASRSRWLASGSIGARDFGCVASAIRRWDIGDFRHGCWTSTTDEEGAECAVSIDRRQAQLLDVNDDRRAAAARRWWAGSGIERWWSYERRVQCNLKLKAEE